MVVQSFWKKSWRGNRRNRVVIDGCQKCAFLVGKLFFSPTLFFLRTLFFLFQRTLFFSAIRSHRPKAVLSRLDVRCLFPSPAGSLDISVGSPSIRKKKLPFRRLSKKFKIA